MMTTVTSSLNIETYIFFSHTKLVINLKKKDEINENLNRQEIIKIKMNFLDQI
jgi:hypothetical protein